MPTSTRESHEPYLALDAEGRRKALEKRIKQLNERVVRAEISKLPIVKAKAEKELNEAWQKLAMLSGEEREI